MAVEGTGLGVKGPTKMVNVRIHQSWSQPKRLSFTLITPIVH